MPEVGFELTIPVFERAKTVHALDCAATVIRSSTFHCPNNTRWPVLLNEVLLCNVFTFVTWEGGGWIHYKDTWKHGNEI
jgi:hypothetical protein